VTSGATAGRRALVLDTMCLSQFARTDRLDVLEDLLDEWDCWTTGFVIDELRQASTDYPELGAACELKWLSKTDLETAEEIFSLAQWVRRICGGSDRGRGEASVFAAAEVRDGIALTDDREATKVARRHDLEVHGTIWLLAAGCRRGKLTAISAGNLIDDFRALGARLPCKGSEFRDYARKHRLL